MNDLRKAAEMALEALEYYRSFEDCQPTPASKTIPALRQALAQPVDAVNISAECVDETAKDRLVRIMGTFDLATGHADTLDQALDALEEELRDVLGHLRAMREWVGLTDEEIYDYADKFLYQHGSNYGIKSFGKAIEAKLKEKNGG